VVERKLSVTGRLGLHARAAANLVRIASQFESSLTLQRLDGSVSADAKSILSILMLAASRGTDLQVIAKGVDEQAALAAVVELFANQFDESDPIHEQPPAPSSSDELRCKGLGVSEGVVAGRVLRMQEGARNVYRAQIEDADIERERRRFRAAVRLSRRQLEIIKARAEKELGRGHAYIFDAHLLFLEDAKLTRDVEDYIVREHANAEWAAKVVGDRLPVRDKDQRLPGEGKHVIDQLCWLEEVLEHVGADSQVPVELHRRRVRQDVVDGEIKARVVPACGV